MANMDLSIIIVNWNSVEYLQGCLASIESDNSRLQTEIIIVDNASYDGSADLVCSRFPRVRFIQSQDNLGFARGNNLGVRHSSGDALLFLNPDTLVRPGALAHMVTQLWSTPDTGGVGARLLNSDGSLQTTCLQAFPTVWNQLIDTDYLRRAFPRWRGWGMCPLFSSGEVSDDVQMISGACLMVQREVFELVGGFSSEYFMYGDDVDLCYKIRQAGYVLRYASGAEIVHHGGQSAKHRRDSGFADVMKRESIYQFLRKTRGVHYARFYRWTTAIAAIARLLALTPFRLCARSGEPAMHSMNSRRKWRRILRWTLGRETWASQYAPPVLPKTMAATKN
jgi:hypothetical protein